MAELADAADSKSADGDIVRVRPPLRVRLKLWRVRAAIVRNASLAVFFCDLKSRSPSFLFFSARLRGRFFLFFRAVCAPAAPPAKKLRRPLRAASEFGAFRRAAAELVVARGADSRYMIIEFLI